MGCAEVILGGGVLILTTACSAEQVVLHPLPDTVTEHGACHACEEEHIWIGFVAAIVERSDSGLGSEEDNDGCGKAFQHDAHEVTGKRRMIGYCWIY